MMDNQPYLFGSPLEWRNRSPDADQEYFIDKMRMLKIKLRKCEDENRLLYRWLSEQKTDVKEALRDKCFVINKVQYEMAELKKHILVLLGVITEDQQSSMDLEQLLKESAAAEASQKMAAEQLLMLQKSPVMPSTSSATSAGPSSYAEPSVWASRNKTLEDNFKKELKKVKELERQIGQLSDTLQEVGRDREDLQEKNAFIEEENNIQREQIALLEDTVRDLEDVAMRTGAEVEDASTQTEVRGEQLRAIMNENVEEILCLVSKLAELQQRNAELESKYEESRRALAGLHQDFHERGKMMSELENELNALKLRDRSGDRCERRRRCNSSTRSCSQQQWEEEQRISEAVLNLDASVFLSPTSSRSCSSNSSAEFEVEDNEEGERGITLSPEAIETKKAELRKFIRNLKDRRRSLHDSYRCSLTE